MTKKSALAALTAGVVALAGIANAAEIKVIGSPGFREAYTELVPAFEKETGHHVVTIWGGVNEVANRVAGGETARSPSPCRDSGEKSRPRRDSGAGRRRAGRGPARDAGAGSAQGAVPD